MTALAIWSGLFFLSGCWNVRQQRQTVRDAARIEADLFYRKLYAYRHWNARQGGVYVPVSAELPPNPFLGSIPERDVLTPSGRMLTLVNPSYMLRKVLEVYEADAGPKGHLTSLRLINPDNRPDPWEREALRAFEQGLPEISGVEAIQGRDYYRLMRPLRVESECLKCHASQGYRVGDIRGGLSASVPLAPLQAQMQSQLLATLGLQLPFWGLGMAGIVATGRRFCRQQRRREKLQQTVRQLSFYDRLTGMPNQALFNDRLRVAIFQAQRRREQLAVLCLDLDHFKRINNAYGHCAGDRLLFQVAQRISDSLRETDTAARFGGDSFTLLLQGLGHDDDVVCLLDRLRQSLARPYQHEGEEIVLEASIGVAVYPADGDEAQLLLKHADTALHLAKQKARGSCQFYAPEMKQRAQARMELENALRGALEREEFDLYYQPQIDAVSGQLIGAEALLRWRHPDGSLKTPASFISLAEESGLIVPIGNWALRRVCRQLAEWQAQGLKPVRVAVNLSAVQFQDPQLVQRVASALEEFGVEPVCLGLEITESAVMHNVEATSATLAQLKALGVYLAIDDFGTGYSSLSYLKLFPLDALKIDRSFVVDLPDDSNSVSIVNAVIALAGSLNLKVLAEGAENQRQLDCLLANGCRDIQGYLFSPPVPVTQLTATYLLLGRKNVRIREKRARTAR